MRTVKNGVVNVRIRMADVMSGQEITRLVYRTGRRDVWHGPA